MHNPENERIKRTYFIYLKEARRLGEHSIDGAAAALAKFEGYTNFRDFKRFHIQQAIGFKNRLSEHISLRTGERLSRGTVFPRSMHCELSSFGSAPSPDIVRIWPPLTPSTSACPIRRPGSPRLSPSGRCRPSTRSDMC